MNFVLVNGRTPFRKSLCVLCAVPIDDGGYLRDIRTRLCYCGAECYARQFAKAAMLPEGQAKAS
jgi:hypothetical protein